MNRGFSFLLVLNQAACAFVVVYVVIFIERSYGYAICAAGTGVNKVAFTDINAYMADTGSAGI